MRCKRCKADQRAGAAQASIWLLETILTATLIFTVFCATDSERGQTAAHIPVRGPSSTK